MVDVKEVIALLKEMRGTREVFELNPKGKEKLIEIESGIKGTLGVSVKNLGLEECLKRDHVLVVIKDVTFRPPPEPTVLLVGDEDIVCGREILPSEHEKFAEMKNVIFLGDDFIIFSDRKPTRKESWVMPPVSFPEVSVLPKVKDTVSCSPSPLGDVFVRTLHGLKDDAKLASIMIGYNDA
jgi:hypothetical protein